ncbi:hypothetical protein C6P45_004131 [Maudiozyma exigua]|uniref:Endoplasmic reticulum-Golgi intermediate compartment protein n=1 Tax=Maudiozyma exigua TaxID=34358 RepID=A0A9P6WFB1_MAUEX|nr:hypothetical protein C6P45_004131 [Kazachstania exigua]
MLVKKSTLLSVDAFSRAEEDVRIRTKTGALITLSCFVITAILIINEWFQFNTIVTRPTLVMDRERNGKLELNLDISFPHISCDILNFDIIDDSGYLQYDDEMISENGFIKIRLDQTGNELEKMDYKLKDQLQQYPVEDENYCGSCYDALDQSHNDDEGKTLQDRVCCQTCEDVRQAYYRKGWTIFDGKSIEQCEREGYLDKIKKHINEGCRVKGTTILNRISGNIHFVPGEGFQNKNGHYHDTHYYDFQTQLNFDHIINHLSFGKPVQNKQESLRSLKLETNPLDGKQVLRHHDTHSHVFTYYTKIVPTRYEYMDGIIVETAQFSTKFQEKPTNGGKAYDDPNIKYQRGGMPGLFIMLDMSPLKVINREQHAISWSGFLLNCVTSIGGILAVGTILDKIMYKTQRTFFKKANGAKKE